MKTVDFIDYKLLPYYEVSKTRFFSSLGYIAPKKLNLEREVYNVFQDHISSVLWSPTDNDLDPNEYMVIYLDAQLDDRGDRILFVKLQNKYTQEIIHIPLNIFFKSFKPLNSVAAFKLH